jgi:hypothetical protein
LHLELPAVLLVSSVILKKWEQILTYMFLTRCNRTSELVNSSSAALVHFDVPRERW